MLYIVFVVTQGKIPDRLIISLKAEDKIAHKKALLKGLKILNLDLNYYASCPLDLLIKALM